MSSPTESTFRHKKSFWEGRSLGETFQDVVETTKKIASVYLLDPQATLSALHTAFTDAPGYLFPEQLFLSSSLSNLSRAGKTGLSTNDSLGNAWVRRKGDIYTSFEAGNLCVESIVSAFGESGIRFTHPDGKQDEFLYHATAYPERLFGNHHLQEVISYRHTDPDTNNPEDFTLVRDTKTGKMTIYDFSSYDSSHRQVPYISIDTTGRTTSRSLTPRRFGRVRPSYPQFSDKPPMVNPLSQSRAVA